MQWAQYAIHLLLGGHVSLEHLRLRCSGIFVSGNPTRVLNVLAQACPDTQFRCTLTSDVTYDTATKTFSSSGFSAGVDQSGGSASIKGEKGSEGSTVTTSAGTAVGSFTMARCYRFLVGCFYNYCAGYQNPTERCNRDYPQCANRCEAQCTKCCEGQAPPWMC